MSKYGSDGIELGKDEIEDKFRNLRSSYRWFLRIVLFRDVRVTDCLNRHQLQKHFYLSDTFLPLPTSFQSDMIIPIDERHWPESFTKKLYKEYVIHD